MNEGMNKCSSQSINQSITQSMTMSVQEKEKAEARLQEERDASEKEAGQTGDTGKTGSDWYTNITPEYVHQSELAGHGH